MRMLAVVLLLGLASELWAEELLIDMTTDDAFSVRLVHIEVGQTITWLPIAKGHNVEFAKGPAGVKLTQSLRFLEKLQ